MENRITYQQAVESLAPCGIDCERCVRFAQGRVSRLAGELREALAGFDNMARRVSDRLPALADYDKFAEVLGLLSQADCTGCRAGGSQLPFCAARTCFKEKGVDFCFQCQEYPCESMNGCPENLRERWREYNDRMRAVGVEAYYAESLTKPRYA